MKTFTTQSGQNCVSCLLDRLPQGPFPYTVSYNSFSDCVTIYQYYCYILHLPQPKSRKLSRDSHQDKE